MRRSELPCLDDLRAFEATARSGSVRAAADEMALTHAAVSRRIGRLALAVGCPLFERAGRGLRLTAAGEELYGACRRSFDDLGRTIAGIREVAGVEDAAILLSCERSVAMRWLIPRLSLFQDANPDVAVHLSVAGGPLDAHRDRASLALRRLDFPLSSDWAVIPLFPERVGPVIAPRLKNTFQAGGYVALGAATRPTAWADWLDAHPDAPRPRDYRTFDHHFLMAEAAAGGLGVALCPLVVVADDLERGRLLAPMGFDADGTAYGLLHPADVPLRLSPRKLADWIIEAGRPLHDEAMAQAVP
jgi:DNA-binding transcriptional LysR family regulator